MSTKAKKPAGKASAKHEQPSKKAAAAEPAKKGGKAAAKAAAEEAPPAPAEGAEGAVDPDEIEEAEDAAAAGGGGGGGNAAALAAAGTGEMSASFKNFRHHPDMENFYRFIYENDLRHEALAIIEDIMKEKIARRQLKGGKPATHG